MSTTPRKIDQLGWSKPEAIESYLRLRNFAEDWDAPGMEAYDAIESSQPNTSHGQGTRTPLRRTISGR